MLGYQLGWGLRITAGEVSHWWPRAACVPDSPLREDALNALAGKRPHLDGAALFATLARRRVRRRLATALIAYEVILEYLDNTNERDAAVDVRNGRQLHVALVDALDPACRCCDHYRHHPWSDDNEFLASLARACRESCTSLPSYRTVSSLTVDAAHAAQVLALNHEPCPHRREARLRVWATRRPPCEASMSWFERAAASTGSLTVHALIALAADRRLTQTHAARACAIYRWISLAATMLDSYVDQTRDLAAGRHCYVGYYPDLQTFAERMTHLLRESLAAVIGLRNGHRHAVILASMIALYLSSDSARRRERRASTQMLLDAGGALTSLLLPVLRTWRAVYGLADA